MNWGYKIMLVFLVFVSGIVYMVIKASGFNNDLVVTDYYEQELKYQNVIDKVERSNELSSPVTAEMINDELVIQFPEEMKNREINADVLLYYPADKRNDVHRSLSTSDSRMTFPVPATNKGLHEVKIEWTADGVSYYSRNKIIIK